MRKKIRNPKEAKRRRRHMSIRRKVSGTADRPRVCVFRSSEHIYAQVIDDSAGRTIAAASSLKLDRASLGAAAEDGADKGKGKGKGKKGKSKPTGAGIAQAREVGRLLAEAAKEKGITKISFDRGGYLFHGRVAALAAAARENGLEF